jgi:hypothetical protein
MDLNPAQRSVVELLGKAGPSRPAFEHGLVVELAEALCRGLAPIQSVLHEGDKIYVSKHDLAAIHSCEANFRAERAEPFRWTTAAARGVVSHKAIELLVHWSGETHPCALVDEACARLVDADRSISDYLSTMSTSERAELRGAAVDRVTKFVETFPPLSPRWCPVTESPVRVELFDGSLVLAGKTDLTLGRPGEKVIIDLKSGGPAPAHREDLRFYALLETLRLGVPPRKVATYYLDAARAHAEDVTDGTLRAALARTIDGVVRALEVARGGAEPVVRPGPSCRWCPIRSTCAGGTEYLTRTDDHEQGRAPW